MDEFKTPDPSEEALPEAVSFKTGFGEDKPSSRGYSAQLVADKLDKLGHKVTLVSIVVLCIIVAAAFFIFFDYQDRIAKVRETGEVKVEGVSKNLQGEILGLSQKMEGSGKDLGKKIASLEKAASENRRLAAEARRVLGNLQNRLDQNLKLVSGRQKAVENDLAGLRKKSEESLSALKNEVEKTRALVSGLNDSLSRLDSSAKAAQTKLASLDAVVRAKLDKTQLDKLLADKDAKISELDKKLKNQAAALEKRIAALEREQGQPKTSGVDSGKGGAAGELPARSSAKAPAQGKIKEQDLTQ